MDPHLPSLLGHDHPRASHPPSPLDPSRRAYDILEPMFLKYVVAEEGQGLMDSENGWDAVLETVPDEGQSASAAPSVTFLRQASWPPWGKGGGCRAFWLGLGSVPEGEQGGGWR